MVTQEIFIYRLVVRNHVFDAFFEINPIFCGKMGEAATVAPRGLGPQDPIKKLAHYLEINTISLQLHIFTPLSLKVVIKLTQSLSSCTTLAQSRSPSLLWELGTQSKYQGPLIVSHVTHGNSSWKQVTTVYQSGGSTETLLSKL